MSSALLGLLGFGAGLVLILFLLGNRRLRTWRHQVTQVGRLLLEDQLTDADRLAERTLTEAESFLSPEDPLLLPMVHAFARTQGRMGKVVEEERLLKRALTLDQASLRPDPGASAGLLQLLSRNLQLQGRVLEAVGVARQALDVAEEVRSPSDPRLGDLHLLVADCELAVGRLDQAEHHYHRALELVSPVATPGEPLIREVRVGLTKIADARNASDPVPFPNEDQGHRVVN